MSLDTDFQSKLQALASTVRVQENFASEDLSSPFVIWQRADQNQGLLNNGMPSIQETNYMVDVYSENIDVGAALADSLKSSLNGFIGLMGESQVLGMFVKDAADDYQPKLLDSDTGFHSFSFQVQILN